MWVRLIIGVVMAASLVQCKGFKEKKFSAARYSPYAVCYAKVSPDQVQNYELVIVEPDFYSVEEIAALQATGTTIIAYVTLGEVDENRWYYPKLAERGFLGKNENWNSFYLNLEDQISRNVILNQVLPKIMGKEVDGLFLDTIDAVAPVTNRSHLQPYMVQLIKSIREKYPEEIIIQNAGLFLLEHTEEAVDAFMTESLASDYEFSTGEYKIRDREDFNNRLDYLRHFAGEPGKPFFILEFADTEWKRSQISDRLDTLNRPYFISNIGLSILPETPDGYANNLKLREHGL